MRFVQARMAMNLREAKVMYAAAMESELAHQICQPPHALKGDWFMQRLIAEGYVGDIRNIIVRSMTPGGIDPDTPLHWRQMGHFSGLNTMSVGMLVEFVHRWCGYTKSVSAHAETYITERSTEDGMGPVDRPDTVNILAQMESGATAVHLFSGTAHHAPGESIEILRHGWHTHLRNLPRFGRAADIGRQVRRWRIEGIGLSPPSDRREWTVEADFIDMIKTGKTRRINLLSGREIHGIYRSSIPLCRTRRNGSLAHC